MDCSKKHLGIVLGLFLSLIIVTPACKSQNNLSADPVEGVNEAWSEWIRANHQPLATIASDDPDFSDLMFLRSILDGKNLVQLGENCHGVSEFNTVKVRLIKFLHEVLGYQVIAFESSIFECNIAQLNIQNLTPLELMQHTIFMVWHCSETLELFRYIKETQNKNNPLLLAGFDVQLSSSDGYSTRPDVFHAALATIDAAYADTVRERDGEFVTNRFNRSWFAANKDSYITFYNQLYRWFDRHMSRLLSSYPNQPSLPRILRQAAWSMVPYIECLEVLFQDNLTEYYNVRDLGMATNVKMLKEVLHAGKKIMVWAHNGHIQNHGSEIIGGGPIAPANNMGYWLFRWFPEEIYTIGLFMYHGSVASTNRQVYSVGSYQYDSLEAILAETDQEFCFVNLQNVTETPGSSWMFEYLTSTEWEDLAQREDETIIHKDHFNGIVFIRNVNVPDYL